MRTGVTLVDITRAADQLLAEGERPTIESVRRVLGTGSPATVNSLLKQYFLTLPTRLNLPASIASAAAELYEKIRGAALETVGDERVALERQMAAEREQLAQERRAFESERTELRALAAGLKADVDRLQDMQRQQALKIINLENDLASQTTRATTAEAQASAGDEERERSTLRQTAEIQRLREQAEGNERHLLVRIEEHKTQQQRWQTDRDREAGAAAKRIGELEKSLSESLKAQASLRTDLASAQREVAKRNEAITTGKIAVNRAQEEAAKEAAVHREVQGRLKLQIDTLDKSVEQLRRERDDAIRDAARFEGQLASLQAQLTESNAAISRSLRSSRRDATAR
jgi:hypothetical protein